MSTPAALSFSCLLQQFFVQRLMQQLHASPRTVAAYRDSFRLLLDFAHRRLRKQPAAARASFVRSTQNGKNAVPPALTNLRMCERNVTSSSIGNRSDALKAQLRQIDAAALL